ncbi:MAG TPA: acetylxylan esterase, partial [Pirellulales bacterium]
SAGIIAMNHKLPRREFVGLTGALLTLPWIGSVGRAAETPQTLDELWADFDELDRSTPLEVEVLKEWTEGGIVRRLIRYQVGVFKGAPARVAAFYAFPQGATKLPAILDLHGGGQSASLGRVVAFAERGYAGLSLNWGGNKLNFDRADIVYDGPQTDWGRLDATHPPQRNKVNHFVSDLRPDEYTLDEVKSPRNSNWYLVLTAARRAVSLLQQQPEVDPQRIGARGHSMGGKLTTNLAGIDKRIKAAVPSCGGSGDLLASESEAPGGSRTPRSVLELACVSDNAYIPRITCPVLWLSPTNDFHGHIDNMAWNWRNIPDDQVRFSIAPHLNHRHTPEHALTEHLWFEQHVKGAAFRMPATPKLALALHTPSGVPRASVTPDASRPVRRVDLYYSIDPHGLTRFWRDAQAVPSGEQWQAALPVLTTEQPIFVFANVIYDAPEEYGSGSRGPGDENSPTFAISSRVLSASPEKLQAASVKATDKPERLIDDGSRGWHDWYLLNWVHAPLWSATTRKLKDPKWRGPDGAVLRFEIKCESDNNLVVTVNCNAWGAFAPGKPAVDYTAVKALKGSPDWQPVSISLADLVSLDPKSPGSLADWRSVTELSFSPHGDVLKDGRKTPIEARPWQGPRAIRNLRWEGGEYTHQSASGSALNQAEFEKSFNDAIKKSLEQEKLDKK